MRCKQFKAIDKTGKENCVNCHRWAGKKCKDEAEILAEWQEKYEAWELMMRGNRGVMMDG